MKKCKITRKHFILFMENEYFIYIYIKSQVYVCAYIYCNIYVLIVLLVYKIHENVYVKNR